MKIIAAIILVGVGTAFGDAKTKIAPMADPPIEADFKSDWLTLTINTGAAIPTS